MTSFGPKDTLLPRKCGVCGKPLSGSMKSDIPHISQEHPEFLRANVKDMIRNYEKENGSLPDEAKKELYEEWGLTYEE